MHKNLTGVLDSESVAYNPDVFSAVSEMLNGEFEQVRAAYDQYLLGKRSHADQSSLFIAALRTIHHEQLQALKPRCVDKMESIQRELGVTFDIEGAFAFFEERFTSLVCVYKDGEYQVNESYAEIRDRVVQRDRLRIA